MNFSTTYHPDIDEKIEIKNHILEDMLCMYVIDHQKTLEDFFPLL
jgi:hypothetical protein